MLELLSQESAHQPLDEIRDWWQQIEQWRARQCLKYDTHSEKIKPQAVIETLWRLTKGDAYVTSDVGSTRCLLHFIIHSTNRVAGSIPVASARWVLVYLRHWASKWRCQKKPWFASLGDGSIQMNIQELSTALQYELPVLVVNLNNRYLGW
ncbi:acetolactate synthase 3 catalytic subunit [Escherichia coli]|nr:acetolactate synthase 3 catalytic subunit [Escherichia coli]